MTGPLLALLIVGTVLAVHVAMTWADGRRKMRRRRAADARLAAERTTRADFLGGRR